MTSDLSHEFYWIQSGSLSFHGFLDQFALHFELGFFILLVKGLLHG